MKNAFNSFTSRFYAAEERASELKNRDQQKLPKVKHKEKKKKKKKRMLKKHSRASKSYRTIPNDLT